MAETIYNTVDNAKNTGKEFLLFGFVIVGMLAALIIAAVGFYTYSQSDPDFFKNISKAVSELEKSPNTSEQNNSYDLDDNNTNSSTTTKTEDRNYYYLNGKAVTKEEYEARTQGKEPSNQATPTPTSQSPYTRPRQTCINFEIYDGELKSRGCYMNSDYTLIQEYYRKYQSADWAYDGANSTIDFVCEDAKTDIFRNACEDAKDDKEVASKDKAKYKALVLSVIARGSPAY